MRVIIKFNEKTPALCRRFFNLLLQLVDESLLLYAICLKKSIDKTKKIIFYILIHNP